MDPIFVQQILIPDEGALSKGADGLVHGLIGGLVKMDEFLGDLFHLLLLAFGEFLDLRGLADLDLAGFYEIE